MIGAEEDGSETIAHDPKANLDEKDQLFSPYFFKKHVDAVSLPNFQRNPERRLAFLNPRPLESKLLKRDKTFSPYFLKRKYFNTREHEKAPKESTITKYPFFVHDERGDLESEKRMNSLDIAHELAAKNAIAKQIKDNQSVFNEAGK